MDEQEEQARRARQAAAKERLRHALLDLAKARKVKANSAQIEASGTEGRGTAAGQTASAGQ